MCCYDTMASLKTENSQNVSALKELFESKGKSASPPRCGALKPSYASEPVHRPSHAIPKHSSSSGQLKNVSSNNSGVKFNNINNTPEDTEKKIIQSENLELSTKHSPLPSQPDKKSHKSCMSEARMLWQSRSPLRTQLKPRISPERNHSPSRSGNTSSKTGVAIVSTTSQNSLQRAVGLLDHSKDIKSSTEQSSRKSPVINEAPSQSTSIDVRDSFKPWPTTGLSRSVRNSPVRNIIYQSRSVPASPEQGLSPNESRCTSPEYYTIDELRTLLNQHEGVQIAFKQSHCSNEFRSAQTSPTRLRRQPHSRGMQCSPERTDSERTSPIYCDISELHPDSPHEFGNREIYVNLKSSRSQPGSRQTSPHRTSSSCENDRTASPIYCTIAEMQEMRRTSPDVTDKKIQSLNNSKTSSRNVISEWKSSQSLQSKESLCRKSAPSNTVTSEQNIAESEPSRESSDYYNLTEFRSMAPCKNTRVITETLHDVSSRCSAQVCWAQVMEEFSWKVKSMETSGGSESSGGEDAEARRSRRGHVLAELLQTERVYVQELGSILTGYKEEIEKPENQHLLPSALVGQADVLFGNLHELFTFHQDVFLKDLERSISATELVALCFVEKRETFFRLYSYYCQNIPRSERLRETLVDTHLFLQACQLRLGHKLPLAAYLLKPVQRITKYQLLLKDLLRYSECGSMTTGLQQALDCMLVVLKCVNDSMHQIAITGVPVDLSQQGELLMQGSFLVVSENKRDLRLRIRPRRRHIFLYEKAMLFCKPATKNSHNKATYHFKHDLQMSQIGLTESVKGDPRKFEVWRQGRQEVHTIIAPTVEIKRAWVDRIKRVLLDQLKELKGERVRQYGAQHRTLIQTNSWDVVPGGLPQPRPPPASNPSRTASCDTHDEPCWSTDPSEDEDDEPDHAPVTEAVGLNGTIHRMAVGCALVALSDYTAVGASEVSLREGQHAELLKVGCAGWWYVRLAGGNGEGWAPAAYLDQRKTSRSSSRSHDRLHEH